MTGLSPVVILAGGLATRLYPVTKTIPKSLLLINDEPFVAHQLRLLARNGVKKVVLCVGYLGEQVQKYVGDGAQFGLSVSYSYDGEKPLGTGGAIKQALPLLEKQFFVLYGDSYLPCDYQAVQNAFEVSQKNGLMTVFKNDGQWDKSNVEFSDGNLMAYNKAERTNRMRHIDYGLGMFSREAFNSLPKDTFYDLADLYIELLKQDQLAAYEVKERFYEAGSFSGIKELSTFLLKEEQCSL